MRKSVQVLLVLGLAALLALAGAGVASAQGPRMGGRGGMGDEGMMGGPGAAWGKSHLSGAALDAVAKALSMTTDELTAQLKGGAILADLADKAGVDLQKVRDAANAAQTQAMKDAIEKAVTDGKLTRAQADWMLQGISQGYSTRGGFMFGFGKGLGGDQNNTELAAAAKVLGMTADQLSTQLWGGRTLAQLADKAGVKLADVQAAMQTAQQAARRAAIEQAVTDGRLTRQQADWLLQGLDKGYLGRGGGMFFGERGHHGMPGLQQGTEPPATPSAGTRFQAPAQSAGQSV